MVKISVHNFSLIHRILSRRVQFILAASAGLPKSIHISTAPTKTSIVKSLIIVRRLCAQLNLEEEGI